MLRRLTIGTKVFIAPALITLLMAFLLAGANLAIQREDAAFRKVVGGPFVTSITASKLLIALADLHADVLRYANLHQKLSAGDALLGELRRTVLLKDNGIHELYRNLEATATSTDSDALLNISDFITIYSAVLQKVVAEGAEPNPMLLSSLLAHYSQLQSYIAELGTRSLESAQATQRETTSAVHEITNYLLLSAALAVILSLLITAYIGRTISRPVTTLISCMTQVASGKDDIEIPALTQRDEIGSMAKAVDIFRHQTKDLRTREESLAQSVKKLRALGDVSQAVNSTIDLETVLSTIVAKAVQLSSTDAGTIYVFDEASQEFRPRTTYGMDNAIIAEIGDRHIHLGETAIGRAVEQRMPIQIPDIQSDPSAVLDVIVRAGFRALLTVPLLGADRIVGALVVRRKEPGEFAEDTVELLQTFATQSVLAIQNARLFHEIAEASRTMEEAYRELKATQANLVHAEKMASLGQLTAGIAHEIKNPLNFVNNFAGISGELLDELREALGPTMGGLKAEACADVETLIATLNNNLSKIAEHGRRADGIVKSMLLHSRGGSGERQNVDINPLIEEALNLAYHGARAQDKEFNITIERDLDSSLDPIELVPQDITRVFLNLFGNSFYATKKRQQDGKVGGVYRPVLRVTTRDLGDKVEVRVRDNGVGVPADVQAKMFTPFFTTKPTGEGTGLGLSISYDIVTQQHGGTITVESRVNEFTEFVIRLPRKPVRAEKPRMALGVRA
jgi:signal transduction histidine kinase/HAMP domain-containing protein